MTFPARIPAALALAAVLAGCGTLPDGRPFADASSALSASVKTSGQAVSDSLRDAGGVMPAGEAASYAQLASELDKVWAERTKATQAATAYSQAIADLIAAGSAGAETTKQVGDSLGALATAAGIPVAAPLAGVAGDLARFLFERMAIVRASQKLEDAVELAQPAVDRIAEHLADESLNKLRPILKSAYLNSLSAIEGSYGTEVDFDQQLLKRRKVLLEEVLKDAKKEPALRELDRLREIVAPRLKERDLKVEQLSAAYKTRLQLVNALANSATAWAEAHRDLASAIREKRAVTVTELQETVAEIKDLIKKVRAL